MHNTIFALVESPWDDVPSEYQMMGCVPAGIDYVRRFHANETAEEWEWLCECLPLIDWGKDFVKVMPKDSYFERLDRELADILEQINNKGLRSTDYSVGHLITRLHDAYFGDRYGTMIWNGREGDLQTLQEFVSSVEEGEIFYKGAVYDFHF